mgnify:CR=1 FL=1
MSFAGLAAGGENVAVIKKMDLAGFMGEHGIVFQISGMEEEDFPENITGKARRLRQRQGKRKLRYPVLTGYGDVVSPSGGPDGDPFSFLFIALRK